MKAVSILLFSLFLSSGVQANSIQCDAIALSTGVQCKEKIAVKHNTTLCHHHIDTDYPTEISSDTYFDTLMEIIYFLALFIIPTAIMYGFMLPSAYLDNEYSLDQGGTFFFLMVLLGIIIVIFN